MRSKIGADPKLVVSYLKLIGVVLIWGGGYHAAKILVSYSDPLTVGFLRWFLAAIVLFVPYYKGDGLARVKQKTLYEWGMLILLSFFGIFLYNLCFFGAEKLIAAETVAIIYAATPCITIVLSCVFLRYKIHLGGWLGIIAAAIGTIGVVSYSTHGCGRFFCSDLFAHIGMGEVLAILSCFFMAAYNMLNKSIGKLNLTSVEIVTFSAIFGAIFLLIPCLIWGDGLATLLTKPLIFWLCLLYLVLFGTVLCYKWYTDSLRDIGISQTVVFQNGVPFATILTGVVLFGQSISLGIILSGTLVVLSVVFTNYQVNRYREGR